MNDSKINNVSIPFGELGKKPNPKHKFLIGTMGPAYKTNFFKVDEFKEELAPSNAEIVNTEINGEQIIIMSYRV